MVARVRFVDRVLRSAPARVVVVFRGERSYASLPPPEDIFRVNGSYQRVVMSKDAN
jgi:hypothetical protein